jgi:hypothetical protein
MRALVFGVDPDPATSPLRAGASLQEQHLQATPMGVRELDDPRPIGPDWVVLRTRLQHIDSQNLRRVGAALDELARRVGFRVIPGLGERVIYRELFPKGLTLLDLAELGEVGIAHITARQELREMIAGLGIPGADEVEQKVAVAG